MSDFRIGLFYGSTTCFTEIAAEKIRDFIGPEIVELHNIKDTPLALAESYDLLIFGLSTWDFGEIQEDWESRWPEIANLDLRHKTIALFGMGDQIGYSEWFQDALGMLDEAIQQIDPDQTIRRIGYWPNEGYDFMESKALTADRSQFVGLALDEDQQYELSDERIATWCTQILEEITDALASS
ncbi:MAG: flavodoxin FldB [Gammaproteobacteria bacterium]|nr:flavodoxin FldB [Gammaproteobacteria bacterium]